uniref:Polycystin cation channel PKD1/PKD2 domain-containing protein n=1 Tax=Haptolina ericina TaxID=156174 RepID=A0A7S3FFV9_9EUKA
MDEDDSPVHDAAAVVSAMTAELPSHLLLELRRELAPVLQETVASHEHPLSASKPLERALRRVLQRHTLNNEANSASGNSATMQLGYTLAGLQRALAAKTKTDAAQLEGFEAQTAKAAATSAAASAELMERRLWDATLSHGSLMEIGFGDQKLEITVSRHMTFAQLVAEATRYWAIGKTGYCIADQHGVQWLDSMLVHEGMRLCAPGTQMYLLKARSLFAKKIEEEKRAKVMYNVDGVEKEKDASAIGDMISAIQIPDKLNSVLFETGAEKLGDGIQKAGKLVGKVDEQMGKVTKGFTGNIAVGLGLKSKEKVENDGFDDIPKCFVHPKPKTRTQMLASFIQICVLSAITYCCIFLSHNTTESHAMCSSLRKALAEPDYRPEHNFYRLRTPADFYLWSRRTLVDGLFPSVYDFIDENGEAVVDPIVERQRPAVVMRQNTLLGGLRLRQFRGNTTQDANCAPLPFVSKDELARPKSTFTSMDPMARIRAAFLQDGYDFETQNLADRYAQQAETLAEIESTLDCYQDLSKGISTEDFGAIKFPTSWLYQRALSTTIPRSSCKPDPCDALDDLGLLQAFRYRNETAWGNPTWFFGERGSIRPDGFGFTLPQSIDLPTLRRVLKGLADSQWIDRQTRKIVLEMNFYNPQLGLIAVMDFRVEITPAGQVASSVSCETVQARKNLTDGDGLVEIGLQALLATWLVVFLAWSCFDAYRAAGNKLVCVAGVEMGLHLSITVLGLGAITFRVFGAIGMSELYDIFDEHAADGSDPPFLPKMGWLPLWRHYCSLLLACTFLVCQVRLMLYYSLFSARLFVLRRTISHAMAKLLPTILLLLVVLLSFAAGGNVLFGANAAQWKDMRTSIVYVVAMLRRPALMDLDRMSEADPSNVLGASVLAPLFYIAFTAVMLWIMGSLVRSVIITAYAEMCDQFHGKPPEDLLESEWPSLSPFHYIKKAKRIESEMRHRVVMARQRKREYSIGLRRQMALGREARSKVEGMPDEPEPTQDATIAGAAGATVGALNATKKQTVQTISRPKPSRLAARRTGTREEISSSSC